MIFNQATSYYQWQCGWPNMFLIVAVKLCLCSESLTNVLAIIGKFENFGRLLTVADK